MTDNFCRIDDILIDKDLIKKDFVCDLTKCKGACCTLKSDYGAPLEKEEVEIIQKNLDYIKNYIPPEHLEIINEDGFWEIIDGEYLTKSYKKHACVFVYYEDDIAKCSIEKAYKEKKINFIKPISCHLFPIRIHEFGGKILKYSEYDECKPALANGKKEKVKVFEFCKTALLRIFSEDWYEKLKGQKEEK